MPMMQTRLKMKMMMLMMQGMMGQLVQHMNA